jgi:hypothetical protein
MVESATRRQTLSQTIVTVGYSLPLIEVVRTHLIASGLAAFDPLQKSKAIAFNPLGGV